MPPTILPIFYCLIFDLPEHGKEDCEILSNGTTNSQNCFKCHTPGAFLFGGRLEDNSAPGLQFSRALWILTIIVGLFAFFANILIISIVRKRKRPTSFDFLLYVLAAVDLHNSIISSINSTAILILFQNWSSGLFTLTIYYISFVFFFLGKSVSSYMTVFITIERYLVISNPLKSSQWFTPKRTRIMTALIMFLSVLMSTPRLSSIKIGYNQDGKNVPSLMNTEYLLLPTAVEPFYYKNLKAIDYIDALVPFPLLVVFNVLIFLKIRNFTKSHKQLTKKMKVDIRAARMFAPVVIMLFFCNVEPIAFFIVLRFKRICYRELGLGMHLSVAVNSAVNLPIYYARGGSFREEVKKNLPGWLKRWCDKEVVPHSLQDMGTTDISSRT